MTEPTVERDAVVDYAGALESLTGETGEAAAATASPAE